MKRKGKATISLLFLSPMIAELLSGSAPPVEFFNPIALLFLVLLYGCGSVLIREAVRRWGKGVPSIILLGGAYGIWEEGVVVKSFFDPNWVDLGILGIYGRWMGVNWIWTLHLTIYHAVVSVTIPIILVEAIYFDIKDESWLKRREILIFLTLFLTDSIAINLLLTQYQPQIWCYLLCIMLITALVELAYKLPNTSFRGTRALPSYKKLWLIGFLWMMSFFFVYWALPYIIPYPTVTSLIGILQGASIAFYLSRFNWQTADIKHSLAIIYGIITFFIILAPLQELDNPNRPDDTSGMSLVGLIFAFLLALIWKRATKQGK